MKAFVINVIKQWFQGKDSSKDSKELGVCNTQTVLKMNLQERLQELEKYRPRANKLEEVCKENYTDDSYTPVSYGVLRLLFADLSKVHGQTPLLYDQCMGCGESFLLSTGVANHKSKYLYCSKECF